MRIFSHRKSKHKAGEIVDSSVDKIVEKQTKLFQKVLVIVLFGIKIALIGWIAYFVYGIVRPPEKSSQPVSIEITAGQGTKEIAQILKEKGIIKSKSGFLFQAYLQRKPLQTGFYLFEQNEPVKKVYRTIASGEVVEEKVTIPEGWRREQIAQLLYKKGLADYDKFLTATEGNEGKLFPDTYRFPKSTEAKEIAEVFAVNYQRRINQLNPTSEQLIIASIIEREANRDEDRPLIASVFLNRHRIGMALEADPTVQYALDNNRLSGLTVEQIKTFSFWQPLKPGQARATNSPYNTYRQATLPPTPISNPGLKSIEAVVKPADTDYLFFISTKAGKTIFSKTFQEHQKNIRENELAI